MSEERRKKFIYEEEQDEDEVDLKPFFQAIWKKLPLIIIVTVIVAACTFAYLQLIVAPVYLTSFTAYVNNKGSDQEYNSVSSGDVSASRSLANTYAEIITGRSVLLEASMRSGLSYSYGKLSGLVSASSSETTEIITVRVAGYSPEEAMKLAENIAAVATEKLSSIVDGSSMRVVDEPYLPTAVYSPRYMRTTVLAAVIAAFVMCVLAVLKELLDDRVKDEDGLETKLGIAVLGTIPSFASAYKAHGKYGSYGYYGYGSSGKEEKKNDK